MARDPLGPMKTERRPSGAMPSPDADDTMARLHDALTTLEWMLDERGAPDAAAASAASPAPVAAPVSTAPAAPVSAVPPAPAAPATGREAAAGAERARPGGVRKPPHPDSLPLLDQVVKPAAGIAEAHADEAPAPPPPPLPFPGLAPVDAPGPGGAGSAPFVLEEPPPAPRLSEVRLGAGAASGGERYGDVPPPPLDPVVYRHLVERLANEIDVIVQAGTEEALARAAADAADKVRRHVELMLPEIVEELARMGGRSRD